MKYLIREMREVVVIENIHTDGLKSLIPCVKKWEECFEVLEEITPLQKSVADTLVRRNNGEILLFRSEDRSPRRKEDIIKDLHQRRNVINVEYLDYYNMILNMITSYERDAIIDNLLKKEEEEWI